MQEGRFARRTFFGVCAGVGVATLWMGTRRPYVADLTTVGVLPDAMNRIRHANPGMVCTRIHLLLPNRVQVRLTAPGAREYRVASWTAGKLRNPDPRVPSGPVAADEQTFALNRDLPLIADLVAAAQRAHPHGGALVPPITDVIITGAGEQLVAETVFEATRRSPAMTVHLGLGERIYLRSVQ